MDHLTKGRGQGIFGAPTDDNVPTIDLTYSPKIDKCIGPGVKEKIRRKRLSKAQSVPLISHMKPNNRTQGAQVNDVHTPRYVFHGNPQEIRNFRKSWKLYKNIGITSKLRPLFVNRSSFNKEVHQKDNGKTGQNPKYSFEFTGLYKCAVCHKRFKKRENFTGHMASHRSSKLNGKKCEGQCLDQGNTSIIKKNSRNSTMYICSTCKKSFITKGHLENHLHSCGKKVHSYKCEICNDMFLKYRSLVLHYHAFHSIVLCKEHPPVFKSVKSMYHNKNSTVAFNAQSGRRVTTQTAGSVLAGNETAKCLANERNLEDMSSGMTGEDENEGLSDVHNNVGKHSKTSAMDVCIVCNRAFSDFSSFRNHLSRPCAPVARRNIVTGPDKPVVEICPKKIAVRSNDDSENENYFECSQDLVSSNVYMCILCKTGVVGSTAFKEHLSKHRETSSDKVISRTLSMTTTENSKDIPVQGSSKSSALFNETDFQFDIGQQESEVDINRISPKPDSIAIKQETSVRTNDSLLTEVDFIFDLCLQESEVENYSSPEPKPVDVKEERSVQSSNSLLKDIDYFFELD